MKDKIVDLMKSEGLTLSRLAEILEIQPSGISHIVSGRNKPRFDLLQKILRRFPRINPDWLLLDSAVMYRQDDHVATPPRGAVENGASDAIDLFNLGSVSAGGSSADFGAAFASNFGAQNSHLSGNESPQKMGENSPLNSAQNSSGNPLQNPSNFAPQNRPNFGASSASIERIIVLYSDGTFRSYN